MSERIKEACTNPVSPECSPEECPLCNQFEKAYSNLMESLRYQGAQ